MTELIEFIIKTIKETVEDVGIDSETSLLDEGILDSISILYLIEELEKKYGIKIEMEVVNEDNFSTVSNIASLVTDMMNEG